MNLELGILFTFGALICWGFGDFFIQRTTRKIGDIESLAFVSIIGSIILLPFAIKDIYLLDKNGIILLLILGLTAFIMSILDFEALKQGKLSVIDVILELELPITIVLAYLFFKESLSFFQFLIIAFIFISIVLIATKSFKHWKARLEKGVLIALVAAILMGLVNFLTASSSRLISPILAIWIPWVIITIICLVFIFKRKGLNKLVKDSIKFKWLILAMGILDTLAWVFYANAMIINPISITTAITESYPAIALFLGLWLNKEKIKAHQYVGAVIAILACFILALTI